MVKKKADKKLFKKPSYKGIPKVSAVKAVSGLAAAQGPVVREVEVKEIVHEDRSLFFKREMDREYSGGQKWLG